jgi:hypothetical protein
VQKAKRFGVGESGPPWAVGDLIPHPGGHRLEHVRDLPVLPVRSVLDRVDRESGDEVRELRYVV